MKVASRLGQGSQTLALHHHVRGKRSAWVAAPHPKQPQRSSRGQQQICFVRTQSSELRAGERAPSFKLLEPLTGKMYQLEDAKGAPATLVMFLCNHCPFVVHLKDAITKLAKEYQAKGVAVVAISSNSVQTHPQDGPDKMAEDAKKYGYTFPYLYDETQEVAKAYWAACTPEFYVLDRDFNMVYHGQFDDSNPSNGKPVTGASLRAALDAVLSAAPVPPGRPSIGCNIKWHPGNEPEYFGAQIVKK